MSPGPMRRGAPLPYRLLAGVEPCPGGWLVVTGKLQGITLFPAGAEVLPRFVDVLDYRPSFDVVALHIHIGLPPTPRPLGRTCDREARKVLGGRRAGAVVSAPVRASLRAKTFEEAQARNNGFSAVQWSLLPRIAEVDREIGPYHQRTVFEVHPELGFYQLNDNRPLRWWKYSQAGGEERRALLERKLHGIDRVLNEELPGAGLRHLLDAAANLWTARRIAARSIVRLPEVPEWDELGLRMEIVR